MRKEASTGTSKTRAEASSSTSKTQVSQEALKYFTDRESYRETFLAHLNQTDSGKTQVLVFHGVGGIGKTSLVRKLGQELDDAKPPFPQPSLPHARFDLEDLESHIQAYREVLVKLRHDLGAHFKIDFPQFDLCLAVMLAQKGGPAPKLVSVNPTLNNVYQFALGLSPLPFTGPIAAAGGFIAKKGAEHIPAFEDWLRKAGGTAGVLELRKRARDDDQHLPDELIKRFVADLKDELPERDGKVCRGVLFLDSYEKLWSGREASRSAQARKLDEWVRKLASFCLGSNVLLVIAGRDRVRWDEDDPDDWNGYLDQHLLGGLSAHDAQAFLFKCGIGQNVPARQIALQTAIIQCCKESSEPDKTLSCHTFYLALCADIVLNDRANDRPDPKPETFRSIPSDKVAKELADRFLQSLHDRAKEIWLEKLSLAPRFNRASATLLLGASSETDGEAAWELLTGFSFLTPQPDGFWRMHGTMRTAVLARTPQDRIQQVHTQMHNYWAKNDVPSLAFYHQWSLDPEATVEAWVSTHTAALSESQIADARALLNNWADITLDEADWNPLGKSVWARTHCIIAHGLWATPTAPRTAVLPRAIGHYEAALKVYTEDAYPTEWAMVQNGLGVAYRDLPTEDREHNLHTAIQFFRAALSIRTEIDFPHEWAATQNNLGIAYLYLPNGDRTQNLQTAIQCYLDALKVYTEDADPKEWAATQTNLGEAYRELPTGNRTRNLLKAIQCYQEALKVKVYTSTKFPHEWAAIQNNLGIAYRELPTGNRTRNLQNAIQCYQNALKIYTEDAYPKEWAATQNNLAIAYCELPIGVKAQNLLKAVQCYNDALNVYTEIDFPYEWATSQSNLATTYLYLSTGNRAETLQNAIQCYQNALRVRTEVHFPREWAETQNNLGEAYRELTTGDRAQNLLTAIQYYLEALKIYTEADFPQYWATVQNNLGLVYKQVPTGDRFEFLNSARRCFADAERGFLIVGDSDSANLAHSRHEQIEAEIAKAQGVREASQAEELNMTHSPNHTSRLGSMRSVNGWDRGRSWVTASRSSTR